MNLFMKQNETYRHREQTCSCQRGEGVGEGRTGNLGLADANCYVQNDKWQGPTLQHRNTGNHIQYPVINYNGKEYEKNVCLSIYLSMNHFAVQYKLTQHCKSTFEVTSKKRKKKKEKGMAKVIHGQLQFDEM